MEYYLVEICVIIKMAYNDTQPRSTVRGHLCLPAEERSENESDTKCLFNLENISKSHLQGDMKYTVR